MGLLLLVVALIPLDSDPFGLSVFLGWHTKNSPYDNAYKQGVDKRDSLIKMIQKVADSIADPAQAQLEVTNALGDPLLASDASVRAMCPARPDVTRAALEMTIGDLKNVKAKPLHNARAKKSLDWAIDQFDIEGADQPKREKCTAYRKALEKLCASKGKSGGKGKGKGKKGGPNEVVIEYKRICESLGVTFVPERMADLTKLFSVLKALEEGIES